MRMVGLPRRHQNLGANLGRSDELIEQGRAPARRERFETWPATTRDFAPRLSFREAVPPTDSRGRRAIRVIFDFQLPVADLSPGGGDKSNWKSAFGNRQ